MSLPKTTHPLFDIEIPSLKTKIKFRPSLYKEEKILLMAKETKTQTEILAAIRTIVNNCAVTENFNVDKLTTFDLEEVFLRLRANSISNVAKVSFFDKGDGKQYDFNIDLAAVKLKWPDPVPDQKIEFGDITILLKYPSCSLFGNKEFWDDPNVAERLKRECVDKVWQKDAVFAVKDATPGEFQEWLDELPMSVVDKINAFISNPPTLYYEIKYKNSNGEDREIKLTTLDDFFSFA